MIAALSVGSCGGGIPQPPSTPPTDITGVLVATVYDLLMAYVGQVDRSVVTSITLRPPAILSVEEAMRRLSLFLGQMPDWASLEAFLPAELKVGMEMRSALASTFSASLELAKQGRLSLRQGQTFGPIYIKEGERQ